MTIGGTEYDNLIMTFKTSGNAFYQIIGVPSTNDNGAIIDPNTWFNISYTWQVACAQCPPGQYPAGCQGGNVGTCTSCAMGTYSNHTGATACASCQLCTVAGYYLAGCAGSSSGKCTKCTN